ncbi:UDP-N-acetylmuramate--L-alanine ligase [Thermithiobacillus tepidarius DSM 3134]|uniref:UDP-N-acetylmuramate--L-alanine ligase n=1 Tax=Thermithiobacillus tepidarius TaxID=929 RepID=UPI00042796A8|nr:UDP-N-acetylmuramate--L-alanine ligase [Thermithiobacillus tepidarius]
MRNWIRRIHFVGIGGAGMRGIAEVLLNLGYHVSGSDLAASPATLRLQDFGATVFVGHESANVRGADVVVISSAVRADNPEVLAAREAHIPVIPRAEMLAELMRFKQGIAVAGTHGKTTTTSLIASILAEGALDPTFVIGGLLNVAGTHAALGSGDYLVAEADESDASFLYLSPVMAVVTNIDADHMQTYDNDFDKLQGAFLQFLGRLPFYGQAVLCLDDPVVRQILPQVQKPVLTYGFSEEADLQARALQPDGLYSRFELWRKVSNGESLKWLDVELRLPGRHNVLNALAAVGIASRVGVDEAAILRALSQFGGVGRRFQVLGQWRDVIFVDDYGHHPREIEATLAAARSAWPQRRLVVSFQPHRYSRTRDLFEAFTGAFGHADEIFITEVYPAGEAPISEASGTRLTAAIAAQGKAAHFVAEIGELPARLRECLRPNDVCLTLGAGSIGKLAGQWPAFFGEEWQA